MELIKLSAGAWHRTAPSVLPTLCVTEKPSLSHAGEAEGKNEGPRDPAPPPPPSKPTGLGYHCLGTFKVPEPGSQTQPATCVCWSRHVSWYIVLPPLGWQTGGGGRHATFETSLLCSGLGAGEGHHSVWHLEGSKEQGSPRGRMRRMRQAWRHGCSWGTGGPVGEGAPARGEEPRLDRADKPHRGSDCKGHQSLHHIPEGMG